MTIVNRTTRMMSSMRASILLGSDDVVAGLLSRNITVKTGGGREPHETLCWCVRTATGVAINPHQDSSGHEGDPLPGGGFQAGPARPAPLREDQVGVDGAVMEPLAAVGGPDSIRRRRREDATDDTFRMVPQTHLIWECSTS